MSSLDSSIPPLESKLRKRKVQDPIEESESAKIYNLEPELEDVSPGTPDKVYGRTPSGTVFTVPETHDMVSELLSPSKPKNASDLIVITILALHISLLFWLPQSWRVPICGILFLFWRSAYNAGIGVLLQAQSADRRLVWWAKNSMIFEPPSTGKNPHPILYKWIKSELETKIPNNYKVEEAPIEYNTWLLFRRLVDLILMCDFTSYCLFAIACASRPVNENFLTFFGRWTAGIALVVFNVWVKLDAHRVVKDYAWYWGDFFFLIDQELTFDGVFEMAPHPMYSVGYAGYYGISLMAASYKVLFISIIAHAAQMAFLIFIEDPHIEKTYNSPPPRKRSQDLADPDDSLTKDEPSPLHRIMGLQNTDLHRVIDLSIFLLHFNVLLLVTLTPSTPIYSVYFLINAVIWRLWYTLGLGFILNRQSNKKSWTRHFIKFGDDPQEAWRQWKGIYHLSMHMCYSSFCAVAWKMYHIPADWNYGFTLLRHVVGVALIALHLWTVVSIYDSLGEFGWFYGDFFFDRPSKLSYNGIYRFLNNPERILGLAGIWGFAIITWSRSMFGLALFSHLLALFFIQFIERPHMQKLYGISLRQQSGLSKGYRRALPEPIRALQGTVDRSLERSVDFIEEFIEAARPKLADGVGTFVRDATALFKSYPARISITRLADDLAGYDPKDYSLSVSGTPTSELAELDRHSGREGVNARQSTANIPSIFEYGAPIKVKWEAPANHGRKDWIGLYMVADNPDRDVTRISSRGRWVAACAGQYDSARANLGILVGEYKVGEGHVSGEVEFKGDKLWWTTGVFEVRYHHAGKHNVMAISAPFEVRIAHFDDSHIIESEMLSAVTSALLPVIQNCLDRDPEIAPDTIEERFGVAVERDGKYAKRVVFAVQNMFGVEFAPQVVMADGNVSKLAWRIVTAKRALVSSFI
jgi:phosphatidylethanolamine N-methyltransferase